ncbi:MAG: ArsR/SmtB family transcription factor [Christensenellales bacterium]|jgi:DNA-binding transcriptional ArsR family regulator
MTQDMNRVLELSDKLKAMSHPHRLCIIRGLLNNTYNVTNLQQQLGIPQPSVSAHLSKLKTAGIIVGRRNGQEIKYRVVDKDARQIIRSLFG